MKPRIEIDRQALSPAEIAAGKDFGQVLQKFSALKVPFYKKTWFWAASAATAVTISAVVMLSIPPSTNTQSQVINEDTVQVKPVTKLLYAEDSPCIQPPIKGAEKKYESYEIDADKGGQFIHPTGTIVKVPGRSLKFSNGDPVRGKVQIHYHEFHDQVDVLLSGIPMTYDSADTRYTFETAGMIDIRAEQNGKPVELEKGKKINVELVSDDPSTQFNLYELDTVQRNWVYLGKDQVRVEKEKSKNISENYSTDELVIDSVISSSMTAVVDKEISSSSNSSIPLLKNKIKVVQSDIRILERKKPEAPAVRNNNKYNFNVDVNPSEFPEFASLKETRFEVVDARLFSREMYETQWEDIGLEKTEKDSRYLMTLTKGNEKKTFEVRPVYEGKSYEEARKVFENKMITFNQQLEQKKKEEQELTAQLRALEDQNKVEIQRNKKVFSRLDEIERQKQQLLAVNSNGVNSQTRRTVSTMQQFGLVQNAQGQWVNANNRVINNYVPHVTRIFQVESFGTFNCDSPKALPKGQKILARFRDKRSETDLKNQMVYFLVELDRKIYYSYYNDKLNDFQFDPKRRNMIVVTLPDKRVAKFTAEEFSQIPKKSEEFEFLLTISESPLESEKEIREFLNFPSKFDS